MKKFLVFFTALLLSLTTFVINSTAKEKTYIHPTFKNLLITDPRDEEIVNPMVPRISASTALNLVKNNQALVIAVAGDNIRQHTVIGAIKVPKKKELDPSLLNKLKKMNKYILLFCS